MQDYVIAEEYTLPSKGLVYSKQVDPVIKIRSMTTNEEMKRLGHSKLPYKMISEIIDDCLIKKPGISAYDMCVADYQFLLHKMRIVTYGKDYPINTVCPVCGNLNKSDIDLESLELITYSDELEKYLNIVLPVKKNRVKLRLQTPRMLDEIKVKSQELLKKSPDYKGEPAVLFTLMSIIESIDGEVYNDFNLEEFIRKLPMRDTNYIIKSIDKVFFGLNTKVECICDNCAAVYETNLPITGEFFGPSID